MVDIRGNSGELGLKASGSDGYFGLIYIGDTAAFQKASCERRRGHDSGGRRHFRFDLLGNCVKLAQL